MRDDYAPLARTFDEFAALPAHQAMYKQWRQALLDASGRRGVPLRVLVDLGCGTGNSVIPWTRRRGLTLIGVDRSASMLREARRKSKAVRWVRQDLTALSLPYEADAVTCHFDALNHVLTADGLARVFRSVGMLLGEGGLFLFDLNTEAFLRWLDGREKMFTVGNHVFMASHVFDKRTRVATFRQTWFVKTGRNYARREVRVQQRGYGDAALTAMLRRAGLRLLEVTTQATIAGQPSRKVYLAEKPRRRS